MENGNFRQIEYLIDWFVHENSNNKHNIFLTHFTGHLKNSTSKQNTDSALSAIQALLLET